MAGKVKKFFEDFKAFALQGNVMNLAVGVIIGGAFNKIVTSLVSDIIMPLIGVLTGGVNIAGLFYALDGGTYASADAATAAGVGTLNYGAFLQNIIDFLIVALSIFVMVRVMTSLSKKVPFMHEDQKPKEPDYHCPYCKMVIDKTATKCPYCTADLPQPAVVKQG